MPRPDSHAPLRRPRPCGHYDGTRQCNITPTTQYIVGWRCLDHSPAILAGTTETVPDPALTVAGLRENAVTITMPGQPRAVVRLSGGGS